MPDTTAAFELPPDVPQFFFDDALVGFQTRLARRWMPAKICPDPILVPDRPWEGRILAFYGTVLPDPEGGYRLYYTNFVPGGPHSRTEGSLFMARSPDGFTWHKPELGLVDYRGSKANNIVMHDGSHFDGPTVIHEPADAAAPYKLMLFMLDNHDDPWGKGWGLYCYTSKDGLRWSPLPGGRRVKAGDRSVLMSEKVNGRYVNFTRYPGMYDRYLGRVIYRTDSADFKDWSDGEVVLAPDLDDAPDVEFYGLNAFRCHDWYVGLLERWDSLNDVLETQLVVSRDTKKWTRTGSRQPFIGATYDWNRRWSTPASNGPVLIGDQMVFYFGGRAVAHGWDAAHQYGAIGWASIPIDRFCAIEATSGGILETVPLLWPGGELVLNADSRGAFDRHPLAIRWTGEITVELLDRAGQPLPDFSGANRATFKGPNTHCRAYINNGGVIAWPNNRSMDSLRGQTIRLRFNLKESRLFTFEARVRRTPA